MPLFSSLQVKSAHDIASCGSLAALLEVSAYPKPGNVHRTRDFPDTHFEHFLASSVAIYPALYDATTAAMSGKYPRENVDLLGTTILSATNRTRQWQAGGNVNFGEILLFAPIAIAAGRCLFLGETRLKQLQMQLRLVIENSTVQDGIDAYRAFQIASPGGMGSRERYDVTNPSAIEEIKADNMTFQALFALNQSKDDISAELIGGYTRTFNQGLTHLSTELEKNSVLNTAIRNTFLHLLSQGEDSLIVRKAGKREAQDVRSRARTVLEKGTLEDLELFDEYLQARNGLLNPGTTADILGALLYVACLCGLRP